MLMDQDLRISFYQMITCSHRQQLMLCVVVVGLFDFCRLFLSSLSIMHLRILCIHALVLFSFLLCFYPAVSPFLQLVETAVPLIYHKQCILADSLQSGVQRQSPANDFLFLDIYHFCPAESSAWTVACPELQVQFLETNLLICPIHFVESSTHIVTSARFELSVLVQTLETSHVVLEPENHSPISYMCSHFFLSVLRKLTALFQPIFIESSYYHCSPCYPLFLGAYILPLHHVLLTCRHVALTLVQNQYSRHDFKVHVSALLASGSVILPHPPPRNVYACSNMYYVVHKLMNIILSSLSRYLCIVLRYCTKPIALSSKLHTGSRERLSIPTGGGRPHLFSNLCIASFVKQGGDQLTPDHVFHYVDHVDDIGRLAYPLEQGFVYADFIRKLWRIISGNMNTQNAL
jgi:hypothetical protein